MSILEFQLIEPTRRFDPSLKSRCLIVWDADGGRASFCVGHDLQVEINDVSSHDADDLGLTPPDIGVWVWEGGYERGLSSCWEDRVGDSGPVGVFRNPSEAEWALLQAHCDPWDENDWLVPE